MVWFTNSTRSVSAVLSGSKAGKTSAQCAHRCAVTLGRLAQRKLHVVREQHTVSADLIFQRQGLRLEFDPVIAGNVRPHVEFSGLLDVRVPELENDFRLARGKAVSVANTPSQDERIVVEPEVGGIQEQHFPDRGPEDHSLVV